MHRNVSSLGIVPGFVRLLSSPADDLGGNDGAGDDDGAVATQRPPSFADVGAAFLKGLPAEAHDQELEDDIGIDSDAADDIDAAPEGAVPEPIRRDDGATWSVESGRWVDSNGKFVAGAAPEGAPSKAAKPAAAAVEEPETEEAAPAATATKITLPGHAERGEEDLELEIDDPAIADRLTRLRNDGMRRKIFEERSASLQQRQAELDEVEEALSIDPVGFTLGKISVERQLELARALLVEHLEVLAPDIDRFIENPVDRERARTDLLRNQNANATKLAEQRRVNTAARQIMNAVEQLVPDSADSNDANDFVTEARNELMRLAQAGTQITPQNVKQLLARRLQRYGFGAAAPAVVPKPAAPASPSPASARPVSDRAREIAARPVTTADAKTKQAQIRTSQVRRAAATRVAPAGVGAAPVQVPVLPPEAQTSIQAASKHMRAKLAGSGWPSTQ